MRKTQTKGVTKTAETPKGPELRVRNPSDSELFNMSERQDSNLPRALPVPTAPSALDGVGLAPDKAPHLEFIDMGGHGCAVVTAKAEGLAAEFVCIPRPINQVPSPDGGPLRYRVIHTVQRWRAGERPRLEQRFIEGRADLSI